MAYAVLLALGALSTGCGTKMWIKQYPEFYRPQLKAVAVLPFVNRTSTPNAGEIVAERLSDALKANGTYNVTAWKELKGPVGDLKTGADAKAAAGWIRTQSNLQAVLIGTVHDFSSASHVVEGYAEPAYPYHGPPYGYYGPYGYYPGYHSGYWGYGGYRVYFMTRNEGHVSVEASLIGADGAPIHAMTSPARVSIISEGSPPGLTPAACASMAADRAVRELVEQFAVVPKRIKIDPAKALRIAGGREGAQWKFANQFKADDEQMFVVVSLPSVCGQNAFVLDIARKDGSGVLAREEFTWSRQESSHGYAFSPRRIYAGGGGGAYVVTFYSDKKPIMKETFRIRK